jgi:hypothetical protein
MTEQIRPEPHPDPPFDIPDHEDFERLMAIVSTKIDEPASEEDWDWQSLIGSVVDPKSSAYVGLSRAMSYLQIKDPQQLQANLDLVMKTAMVWADGLFTGYHYAQPREED